MKPINTFADKKIGMKALEQSGGYALSADGEDIIILGKDTKQHFMELPL